MNTQSSFMKKPIMGFGAQVDHRGKFRRAVLGQVLLHRTAIGGAAAVEMCIRDRRRNVRRRSLALALPLKPHSYRSV